MEFKKKIRGFNVSNYRDADVYIINQIQYSVINISEETNICLNH